MIKIGFTKEIDKIKSHPAEVKTVVLKIASTLEEYYGVDRHIDNNLGGYILIIENVEDFKKLNRELYMNIEKDALPEFVELIRCVSGQIFTNTLILCNNDFGISIIIPIELTPAILKEYLDE